MCTARGKNERKKNNVNFLNFKTMIQFILMLLGLAFSNNSQCATTNDNTQNPVTVQSPNSGGSSDPGTGTGTGDDTGGNTGQKPPLSDPDPSTNP